MKENSNEKRVSVTKRYFSAHDYDNPFTRLRDASTIGFGLSGLIGFHMAAIDHLTSKNIMKSALVGGKIVGYGVAGAAAHSITISVLSGMQGRKDKLSNHFIAGLVSGAIITLPKRSVGSALSWGIMIGALSVFGRQTAIGTGFIDGHAQMETDTGIRNNRMSLSLRHRFMNENRKEHDNHLEKFL